ncbi:cysteine-rich CWC family protein [Vibrio gazogenes]|uniref:cysteine-rich CWC family protein n=1 Tax=Vibrio gazogenes TaxID=687 RepID=UPI003B27E5BB
MSAVIKNESVEVSEKAIKSPCVGNCKNEDGLCSGCYRTMEEIRQWRHYTDQQREQIMQRLNGTDTSHACPQCGEATHCGISAGESDCWCFHVSTREKTGAAHCLCRRCLARQPLR